jgi:DNA-binding IclR family transcriptional regulator
VAEETKRRPGKSRKNDGFSGVDAVERALTLLDAFNSGDSALTLKELSQTSGLTKTTILRLSVSLEKFSYLTKDDNGLYHLGPMLWRLGSLFRQNLDLERIIKPVLEDLVAKTEESASFYIPRGDYGICLYRVNSKRLARDHVEAGDIIPMGLGSSGQVLKAFSGARGALPSKIRKEGTYLSKGERDPDVAGIAAAIIGPGSEVIGSLSISGLLTRFDEERVEFYRNLVLEAARTIEYRLGNDGS